MSYFNHSFSKRFLGTGATRSAGIESVTNPFSTGGLITTAGTTSATLSTLAPGYFMFANKNYEAINTFSGCCSIYIISSALQTNDKIGPFHGGYKETNKSKLINPKYVSNVYKVEDCVPQQAVVSLGTTPQTIIPDLPTTGFQSGTVQSNCCYNYLCGETYYLRIDIKGSPALRALNHNAYQTLGAYTGCCADQTGPVFTVNTVDPTLVYLNWAKQIVVNNYLKDFVAPVVYDYTGQAWYAPGTTLTYDGLATAVTEAEWWTSSAGVDQYAASVQAAAWTSALPNACEAGMRLFGAYVETTFLNCSFQITDFYEKEPVKIYASLTDLNGDPCTFEGLCVYNDCLGHQGIGFGETVVRDLIMSESYLQNFFHSDIRIREITQGNDILNSVTRASLYTRHYIQHVVPRFNNPSGVFDNDRYLLEIITPSGGNATLDTYLESWLAACVDCVTLETQACSFCEIVPDNI